MAINTYKEDEQSFKGNKLSILKRVLKYYAAYKLKIAAVIIMVLITSALVIILPKFAEYAIDVNVASKDLHGLYKTIAMYICAIALLGILYWVRVRMLSKITNEIVYTIRQDAFTHLQTLSLFYFDSRPTGKILSRLINDVSSLKEMLTKVISTLIPNAVQLIGIMIVMLLSNAKLALSVFILIPVLFVSIYFVNIRNFKNWEDYRKKTSNMNAYTHESYTGIKVIQAFSAEQESIEECDRILSDVHKKWVRTVGRADLMNIVVIGSQGLGYFVLYLFAVKWLHMGASSIGELVAFATYSAMFWSPIRQLATMINQLTNQITGAGRVFELLDTESTLQEKPNAKPLTVSEGRVEFKNICFAYPDEPEVEVLHNINFTAEPGQMIALVGSTGSGKTTIVNLLDRFYDPVSGQVLVDGQDISEATIASLRSNIGVMTQEPFLFSGTVRENLVYGKDNATEDEILNACQKLGLMTFINSLPAGLDSPIKQESMSHGQKQMIALARTLIANPKILILDEATSAIDTRTEQIVQEGMSILMEGRTSFVVAHRLSTIIKSDRIMVINDKGIAESGTHRELLAAKGLYEGLYKAQFEEL